MAVACRYGLEEVAESAILNGSISFWVWTVLIVVPYSHFVIFFLIGLGSPQWLVSYTTAGYKLLGYDAEQMKLVTIN